MVVGRSCIARRTRHFRAGRRHLGSGHTVIGRSLQQIRQPKSIPGTLSTPQLGASLLHTTIKTRDTVAETTVFFRDCQAIITPNRDHRKCTVVSAIALHRRERRWPSIFSVHKEPRRSVCFRKLAPISGLAYGIAPFVRVIVICATISSEHLRRIV